MMKHDRALATFGRNVARNRDERGLSQDALAERADLDRTYLSGIERGSRNPGVKTVVRLARALDADVGGPGSLNRPGPTFGRQTFCTD